MLFFNGLLTTVRVPITVPAGKPPVELGELDVPEKVMAPVGREVPFCGCTSIPVQVKDVRPVPVLALTTQTVIDVASGVTVAVPAPVLLSVALMSARVPEPPTLIVTDLAVLN
jgi:hypothetical protein